MIECETKNEHVIVIPIINERVNGACLHSGSEPGEVYIKDGKDVVAIVRRDGSFIGITSRQVHVC